ncbi:MAG: FAD-dependent oxidoreductase [Alphaproteobacteria bacterium]|jgi:2,4-dienoyl-CoA reductase-like NADH-dependent reductase (Old Yellow Enzyme family)|nr:FAD-dependent oxidoreductase [Alphaproteobacteria bacterium]
MTQTVFPNLFSAFDLGRYRFRNRIFVTGHMTMMVTGGVPNDQQVAYYKERARGGVGLIVMEAAAVHKTALRGGSVIDASDDACIPGYSLVAEACAEYDCPVIAQLFHPGREMTLAPDGSRLVAYAPSAVPNERFRVMPRALPESLIHEIVSGYGDAARRLENAGLAGTEIVASMGYLPSQFLNPNVNQRCDEYGGNFENRLRFLREVIANIRDKTKNTFLLGVRISIEEMTHDGLDSTVSTKICQALDKDRTLDYLNIIAGSSSDAAGAIHIAPPMVVENAYLAAPAGHLRGLLNTPIFLAGRINQPQDAEAILDRGQADMCGMTRATICDPNMPNKAAAGETDDIRACIACNQACIGHEQVGYPISCIQRPETGRELIYGTLRPAPTSRKIMVVGGGPAGMKASIEASRRGHAVTLYEATRRLGGQALLAQQLPGRAEFGGLISNLEREIESAGVKVQTATLVDIATIEQQQPDAIVLATGALPYRPPLELSDDASVVEGWSVIDGSAQVGASVVIADWRCDWVGLGIAEKLVREGCQVRLCVSGIAAGEFIQPYVRDKWNGILHSLGVKVIPYMRLVGADVGSAYLQHTVSGEISEIGEIDTVVLAQGHIARTELENSLAGYPFEIHVIGDCLAPRTAEEAILEGMKTGHML